MWWGLFLLFADAMMRFPRRDSKAGFCMWCDQWMLCALSFAWGIYLMIPFLCFLLLGLFCGFSRYSIAWGGWMKQTYCFLMDISEAAVWLAVINLIHFWACFVYLGTLSAFHHIPINRLSTKYSSPIDINPLLRNQHKAWLAFRVSVLIHSAGR